MHVLRKEIIINNRNKTPIDSNSDKDLLYSLIAAAAKGDNEIKRAMQTIEQDLNKASSRLAFLVYAANELLVRYEEQEAVNKNQGD